MLSLEIETTDPQDCAENIPDQIADLDARRAQHAESIMARLESLLQADPRAVANISGGTANYFRLQSDVAEFQKLTEERKTILEDAE